MEISTSLLTVDEEKSVETFYRLETAHTDYFHIDVMDGIFVEKNTIEIMKKYIDTLENITNIPMDIHLMVKDVKKYIDIFSACSPRIINIHIEACADEKETMDLINYIKQLGCMVGITINPNTEVDRIYKYLPYVHNVLVMSVFPGKGGQEFIPSTVEKISTLKKYIEDNNYENKIEVDGGINIETAKLVKDAGAEIIVSGNYIISSKDYKYTINNLKNI